MITYAALAGETDPQRYPYYEFVRGDREQTELRLPLHGHWMLSEVDRPSDAVLDEAERRHPGAEVLRLAPQIDAAQVYGPIGIRRIRPDDIDAALHYLALGGVLVRLPDEPGARASWGLYAVIGPNLGTDESRAHLGPYAEYAPVTTRP